MTSDALLSFLDDVEGILAVHSNDLWDNISSALSRLRELVRGPKVAYGTVIRWVEGVYTPEEVAAKLRYLGVEVVGGEEVKP